MMRTVPLMKGYQCDHRAHPYVVICPVTGCGSCGQSLAVRGWGGVSDQRGRICVPCAAWATVAALRPEQQAYEARKAAR